MSEPQDSKDTLETMQEMMRQLTVLTKNVASLHDPERHRNHYGPKPYWNNNRRPEGDRRRPEFPESSERKNVNWCDENEEEPSNTSYPDDHPNKINFINDLSFDDGFGRILLEEEPWEHEEEFVDEPDPSCCATDIPKTKEQPQLKIYKRRDDPQPCFLDKHK